MSSPRVLFLAGPEAEYVADGLFHGLRTLLGAAVVDWPKRWPLYEGADMSRVYGKGFGYYGLLPDIPVDRDNVFEHDWDLVVTAAIWRDWRFWVRAWRTLGDRVRHAVVDGGDLVWMYPYGPTWWRSPRRWFLPRAHSRASYFKREWTSLTMIAAARRVRLEPIAIAYPAQKIVSAVPEKSQDFASHVVDLEVGERLGRRLAHSRVHLFEREDDYLADLRASRFGVTTKRAGWDALRHVEIAAAGAVPCFRRLWDKPDTCAPYGLVDRENCLAYSDADHLLELVREISDADRVQLAEGALSWARENTTEQRARSFMERVL